MIFLNHNKYKYISVYEQSAPKWKTVSQRFWIIKKETHCWNPSPWEIVLEVIEVLKIKECSH